MKHLSLLLFFVALVVAQKQDLLANRLNYLSENLELDKAQEEKIYKLMETNKVKFQEIFKNEKLSRTEKKEQFKKMKEEQLKNMEAVLKADQKLAFKLIVKQYNNRKEMFKANKHMRRGMWQNGGNRHNGGRRGMGNPFEHEDHNNSKDKG